MREYIKEEREKENKKEKGGMKRESHDLWTVSSSPFSDVDSLPLSLSRLLRSIVCVIQCTLSSNNGLGAVPS